MERDVELELPWLPGSRCKKGQEEMKRPITQFIIARQGRVVYACFLLPKFGLNASSLCKHGNSFPPTAQLHCLGRSSFISRGNLLVNIAYTAANTTFLSSLCSFWPPRSREPGGCMDFRECLMLRRCSFDYPERVGTSYIEWAEVRGNETW